jgi:cellulose synthase/poly-beta-1,6-N-acetylglucosamine synthase-like glycosyltransferase
VNILNAAAWRIGEPVSPAILRNPVFWYWLVAAPALLLSLAGLWAQRKRSRYIVDRLDHPCQWTPPVTLIVPVKGQDEGLRENLAALASLDYPDYELLIVARTASDIPPHVLPRRVKVVLAGAGDSSTGEKVQNLQRAVCAARKRSQILAFADSDGRPAAGWLRALVAPLEAAGAGASTGYRWFTPQPPTFWSLMASVWNSAAGGLLGAGDCPFAWGGAMAMRKETFFETRVPEFWKDAVSDDYALSAAVHAAGLTIAYAPGALTPSFDRPRCLPFFRWIRRQMTITRVYSPRLWWSGLAAHLFYCAAMLASFAAACAGYRAAALALALQLGCGMALGWRRARLAQAALPDSAPWFQSNTWAHVLLVPLATWVWLISFVTSAAGNSIAWRGRVYQLRKPVA